MPTIYEVARAAGVSPATVSRALNRPASVRAETRERVYAASRELGYAPRADIDARRRSGARAIGVVGPFSAHDAARRRLGGLLRAARALGFEVVVLDHGSVTRYTSGLSALPAAGRVDGIVLVSLPVPDAMTARLRALDVPAVVLDEERAEFISIPTDDEAGGDSAAEHLWATGMRDFVVVRGDDRADSPSGRRSRGFVRSLERHGAVAGSVTVAADPGAAARAIVPALRDAPSPVGIFCTDDERAALVVQACNALSLRVPQDVAVVGYDDSLLSRTLGITTVRQPLEESGEFAMRQIAAAIDGDTVARRSLLGVDIVQRSTTATLS